MRALIDGDIILYSCGFASQHTWYYVFCLEDLQGPGCMHCNSKEWIARFRYKKEATEWAEAGLDLVVIPRIQVDDEGLALSNTRNFIKRILKKTRATEYTIYFSDSPLEREKIATLQGYKENRKGAPKPFWYKRIKEYVLENYITKVYTGLEADDGMAIDQKQDRSTIICTADKDLNMVPGLRYREGKIYEISEREGQLSFYTQLLTGDPTDNIPGLFKLTGTKATAKIKAPLQELQTDRELYEYVRGVYSEHGCDCAKLSGWDVVLLEVGRLLWMRRDLEHNWEIPT